MKRFLFAWLLVALALAAALPAQDLLKADDSREPVTRSYELKHITPRDAATALKSYTYQVSYNDSSSLLTVTLARGNVAPFEENLKRLDVEKQAIQFRIFTVIASPGGETGLIESRELKGVLDELQKVLSFRSYRLDGASTITLTEGSDRAIVQLKTTINNPPGKPVAFLQSLNLRLDNIRIESANGSRTQFKFGFALYPPTDGKEHPWISAADTTLKDRGYLVAGVSQQGQNGDSLVLVINAEIKK